MSLGVLNNIAAIYAQNNLNNTSNSLQNTLTQLSSGSRINSGADDAAGLAIADGLHANVAALTQSTQNASDGIGLLQTADGALSQVTNLLNRAVTLATEASNGTLTSNQVSSANQEYQNILGEVGNIGSTTNFNSTNVFTNTAKTIFVSDGTAGGANSFNNVVGALSTASVGVTAPVGSPVALAPSAASTSGAAATASSTFTVTGTKASGTLSIGFGSATPVSLTIANGAVGDSIANIAAQINGSGALAAQGITAVATSATVLTISGPANSTGALTFGGTTTDVTATSTIAAAPVVALGSSGKSTVTLTPSGPNDTYSGTLAVKVASGSTNTLTVKAGTTGLQLTAQVNGDANYAAAGITAAFNATTGVVSLSGPTGASHDLNSTGTALTDTPGTTAGVDFTNATISGLSAASAKTVLTSVTTAIADVAYQRGIIGANINQLTAASQVASAESENLTSAESSIRSTNYGTATSDLAKFKVLSSTGISALAQANSVQQEITKLLQ